MRAWFWRVVDDWAAPGIAGSPVADRLVIRIIAACGLIGVANSIVLVPLNVAEGQPPIIPLVMMGFWLSLVFLARRPALTWLATTMMVGGFFVLSAILPLVFGRAEMVTDLGWLMLVGITPFVTRGRLTGPLLLLLAVAAAVIVQQTLPPLTARTLTPVSDVIPVVVALWIGVLLVLGGHERTMADLEQGLVEQRGRRRLLDANAGELESLSNETLGFLTTMSHELRTPLNGVLGMTDLLENETIPEGSRRHLTEIRGAGLAVLRTFDTLLCLARTTADGSDDQELVDLPATLDAAMSRAGHESVALGEDNFFMLLPPALPRLVSGHAVVLRTLLDQLLGLVADSGAEQVQLEAAVESETLLMVIEGHGRLVGGPDQPGRDDILELGLPLASELARTVGGRCDAVELPEELRIELRLPCRVEADVTPRPRTRRGGLRPRALPTR